MDKSYIMGVDVSSIGTYNHWSPLADFTSSTLAKISDELPVPNGMIVTKPELHYKAKGDIIIDIKPDSEEVELSELVRDYYLIDTQPDKILDKYKIITKEKNPYRTARLKLEVEILKYLSKYNKFNINPELIENKELDHLISRLNRHNSHIVTEDQARNIIQHHIIKVSSDERNMKAGYSPIDVSMDYFKDALKMIEDISA